MLRPDLEETAAAALGTVTAAADCVPGSGIDPESYAITPIKYVNASETKGGQALRTTKKHPSIV